MRQFLADAAYWLAIRSLRKGGRPGVSLQWKIRWLRRSEFWSDVECWFAGLGSWREIRARRRRRRQPLRRTDITLGGIPLQPIAVRRGPAPDKIEPRAAS